MTIVVGYKTKNKVVIAADSQGTAGYDKSNRADQKVFVTHGIGYGFCGSYRMGQIIKFHSTKLKLPKHEPYGFVVTDLVPMWRRLLAKHGSLYKSENIDGNLGSFILAVNGHLFTVESDFQVAEQEELFTAQGCGAAYALGSLFTTASVDMPIKDKVICAITAAQAFSSGCGGRIDYLKV